ncbi:hypothetical protein [Propionivibrio sp.]|uniref:hypothetical protein n=1 Tax=Propionivibrio sp. TaxID=2212460 RepID=UPI003BF2947C
MTVSAKAKSRLAVAVTSKVIAEELVAAIDSQGSGPAAVVSAIGTTVAVPAAACAGASAPTAAQVNTAIDTVTVGTEARLDAIESKVNDILVSLKAAALMASA